MCWNGDKYPLALGVLVVQRACASPHAARLLTTTRKGSPLVSAAAAPVNVCAAAVGATVNANASGLSCFAAKYPSALDSPRCVVSLSFTPHSRPARCSSNSTNTVALLAATPKPLFPSYQVRTRCAHSKAGRRDGAEEVAGEGREQQGRAQEITLPITGKALFQVKPFSRPHREQQWQTDGRGAASAFSSCPKPLAPADNTRPHREQQWQTDGRGAASAFSSCPKPLAPADNTRPSPLLPPSQDLRSSTAGRLRRHAMPAAHAALTPSAKYPFLHALTLACHTLVAVPSPVAPPSSLALELKSWLPIQLAAATVLSLALWTHTGRRGEGRPLREAAGGAAAALISRSPISGGEGRWGQHRYFPMPLPCGRTLGDGREGRIAAAGGNGCHKGEYRGGGRGVGVSTDAPPRPFLVAVQAEAPCLDHRGASPSPDPPFSLHFPAASASWRSARLCVLCDHVVGHGVASHTVASRDMVWDVMVWYDMVWDAIVWHALFGVL
ncbi:unnamed protein product [Closterium sp. NIES-64]|nr:unnamed protein product [Closterium sp. NIES-64]